MTKMEFEPGTSTTSNFWCWIEERCRIYNRRLTGMTFPWTKDSILRENKFTNVYRQADKGTVWILRMLNNEMPDDVRLWNIIWYRFFNWYKHAEHFVPGYCKNVNTLENYIRDCYYNDRKIFTGCHMTTSIGGELKHESYIQACWDVWHKRHKLVEDLAGGTMENAFVVLKSLRMVGPFVSYEMVCDLRFTNLIDPKDKMSWANVGPGAKRGMIRLGLDPTIATMQKLLAQAPDKHLERIGLDFELREVEHSLCEFDKYERIRLGQGRSKERYRWTK